MVSATFWQALIPRVPWEVIFVGSYEWTFKHPSCGFWFYEGFDF